MVNITAVPDTEFINEKCHSNKYNRWQDFRSKCEIKNLKIGDIEGNDDVEKLYHIFRDNKVFETIKNDYKIYLNEISNGNETYLSLSRKLGIDKEYLFYYLFPLRQPFFSLCNKTYFISEYGYLLTEEEKSLFKYYDSFNEWMYGILDFFKSYGFNFSQGEFSYDGNITINNKSFKRIVFLATGCVFLDVDEEEYFSGNAESYIFERDTLYISKYAFFDNNEILKNYNSYGISSSFKVSELSNTDKKIAFGKKMSARFQTGLQPSFLINAFSKENIPSQTQLINDRKKEKILSLNEPILFNHPIKLDFDPRLKISKPNIDDIIDGICAISPEKAISSFGVDSEYANLVKVYVENGKIYDMYIKKQNDRIVLRDIEYSIKLEKEISIYEMDLTHYLFEKQVYFFKDKEIGKEISNDEYFMLEKYYFSTPDFYFPDGIYINGVLCYWIELKRSFTEIDEQIMRYTLVFGQGALLMEVGYSTSKLGEWISNFTKLLPENTPLVLNGLYPITIDHI